MNLFVFWSARALSRLYGSQKSFGSATLRLSARFESTAYVVRISLVAFQVKRFTSLFSPHFQRYILERSDKPQCFGNLSFCYALRDDLNIFFRFGLSPTLTHRRHQIRTGAQLDIGFRANKGCSTGLTKRFLPKDEARAHQQPRVVFCT